ncbi:MAG: ABC transporter ATP-binding protein, partial [Chloroflexi bacterium]
MQPETKRPLLEVRDLRTQFSTPDGLVKAVNGVSFTLREGEALGLVGESGCGKSVSALSLMRLIPQPPGRIVSGQVWFDGRNLLELKEDDIRKVRGNDIAMIFQDPMTSLNPVLTIGRQIGEALELHKGLDRAAARRRTIELLELVGIPAARNRVEDYPHQFSGGMRQRVMIAMALSCEPKLLIADEPTTALDVTLQAQILDLIKRRRYELGMAIIMMTHDMGVVCILVRLEARRTSRVSRQVAVGRTSRDRLGLGARPSDFIADDVFGRGPRQLRVRVALCRRSRRPSRRWGGRRRPAPGWGCPTHSDR